MSRDEVIEIQQAARNTTVDRSISRYIVDLVEATRQDSRLRLGASPRALLGLFRASQAAALADGRDYVLPDDVQRLTPYVIPHRLILNSKAKYDGTDKNAICREIVEGIRVPT